MASDKAIKAQSLMFRDLVDINPRNGIITLNTRRLILVSVEAMGILRRDLANTLGMDRAKGFLMCYGWANGYKDGEAIERMFDWESRRELMLSGPALHTSEGIVTVEPDLLEMDEERLYFSGYWRNSYEAKEHIRHFGRSESPICWTLSGYASGFLTRTFGKQVLVKESHCVGKNDSYCYFVARTVEDWPPEERGDLQYYEAESLASELDKAYQEICELNRSTLRSQEIREKLTNLMLEGRSLQHLVEYLVSELRRSILIQRNKVNEIFEAAFAADDHDEFYKYSGANLDLNLDEGLVCDSFELKASHTLLGTMLVIGSTHLSKRERLIIEQAANVFTIQMFHQHSIARSVWKMKEDFFEEVLAGKTDEETLKKRAGSLDISLSDISLIVSIKIHPNKEIESVLNYISLKYPELDLYIKQDTIVIMLPRQYRDTLQEEGQPFEAQVLSLIKDKFSAANVYIGSGRHVESFAELGKSYLDAIKITEFLRLASPHSGATATYEQLEPIMLFLNSTNQEELLSFCRKTIGKLVEHDKTSESNLLLTLKTYLDCGNNLNNTSKELHLSIAGLRYRLRRIEELCGIDLNNAAFCFNCYLAIQIYFAVQSVLLPLEGVMLGTQPNP